MRKNSQRIIAGALMLTVLVSTGCSVQNSQQTVTEQQTQQSTTSETEPETGAPVADRRNNRRSCKLWYDGGYLHQGGTD